MRLLIASLILSFVPLFIPSSGSAVSAFPGAEGFGAESTTGGRGRDGSVYIVNTLSDDPNKGVTFREACEASGKRYVVFAVSGHIVLESKLTISNSNITIAGQTSPGGVCITGYWVEITASDVIITHMRFRPGTQIVDYEKTGSNIRYYDTINSYGENITSGNCDGNYTLTPPPHPKVLENTHPYPCVLNSGADPDEIHALVILGNHYGPVDVDDIVIDHCSFAWGVDETVAIVGGVTDMTFSRNIVAAGLGYAGHSEGEHSKGLLVGTYSSSGQGRTVTLSMHHNYIVHSADRNPLISGTEDVSVTVDVVNNVVFDWYGALVGIGWEDIMVNWVHNYMKPGAYASEYAREITYDNKKTFSPADILYVDGNIGATRVQTDDNWNVGWSFINQDASAADWEQTTRWPAPAILDETEMSSAYAAAILSDVGATKPFRDSVDTTYVNDFGNSTSRLPVVNVTYPGDFATYPTPLAPKDSDSDGMDDAWEASRWGSTAPTARGDEDGDGYDNLEEYLHYLGGYSTSMEYPSAPSGLRAVPE